ncbi:MAG TPA: efflux RND transporter periplasmic adaptor subunit [Paraburkholderia sp.]|jgi:membrane fusion protein (multidrug efflux system)|nr:efflux RND transporter periplasmic adaptor subunit [Paraburkholderia sp.]
MSANREATLPRRLGPRGWLLVLALVAGGVVAVGVAQRHLQMVSLRDVAADEAVPQVQLVSPADGPPVRALTLPGTVRAYHAAPIYAQVSGYVQHWYKDYGAPVKAGDLLATIDAPTVDEQYQSALADLGVAQTDYRLAQLTARRWQALAGTQAVSQQEVDVKAADAEAQGAKVKAASHQVARYRVLEGFTQIKAPFDGVVTSRKTDVGNYVNAAGGDVGSRGSADELFSVADIHEVRVFVSVPQDDAAILHPGLTATLTLPQYPQRQFKATFDTSANAFDPQTRTVVAELLVPNPDHLLWPGSYAEVHFDVPLDRKTPVVPEQALLFRSQGTQVAVVGADRRVHLRDVKLGLNFGSTVQVLSGVSRHDRLVLSPSAGLLDGQTVHVVQAAAGLSPNLAAGAGKPAAAAGGAA